MSGKKNDNFYLDFLLGGVSAAISKTATAPIERVKLLMQLQNTIKDLSESEKYKSPIDCFRKVVKNEGTAALWRGNFANVIRYFPTQALNFSFNAKYKEFFCPYDPKKQFGKFFVGTMLSGGAAGATSLLFVYPLDFTRTRLAADIKNEKKGGARQFNGMGDCLTKIAKSDGFFGLYRGFGISILGIFPYRAAYFGLFDTAKKIIPGLNDNLLLKFFVANCVTASSGLISYPFDTVRRRLMMMSGQNQGEAAYKGTIDCFSKIFQQEGFGGFYKGAVTNIFRGVGASLVLVLYDEMKKIFGTDK